MKVCITIDIRERGIHELIVQFLSKHSLQNLFEIETKQLHLGDFIISTNGIERLIVERKSIADLNASIKDKRYQEQSYRLDGETTHNHNILYVIEGTTSGFGHIGKPVQTASMYSAMFSLLFKKGFSVLRTVSKQETAELLVRFAIRLKKYTEDNSLGYYEKNTLSRESIAKIFEKEGVIQISTESIIPTTNDTVQIQEIQPQPQPQPQPQIYASNIRKVKQENITTENIGEIMLMQIPRVSANIAHEIMMVHGSIPGLLNAYRENSHIFEEFRYGPTSTKKLHAPTIANLHKFLI
jgi:ERCC4-type nuclease